MIEVRTEAASDQEQVREVNRQAFSQPNEAALVDALRGVPGCISLVAAVGSSVIGHILFSPVEIHGPSSNAPAAGLGPMSVRPERQRQGVGSRLVRTGLEECCRQGYDAVVVVGHPSYYPRFGFVRASVHGLRYEQPVPDEVFMALELRPGALSGGGGIVKYHREFARV
jgi:putative acetyltransferase